ncbi:MAG: PEP-CTERM sorting domain-containing protein [Pirellulales bacterium]|nr:PEP-CTERM sorting domain-containing protein [Pirellulales bacterium]
MKARVFFCLTVAALMLAGTCGTVHADYISALTGMSGLTSYWNMNETGGATAADSVPGDAVDGNNVGTYTGTGVTLGVAGPQPGDGFLGFDATNLAADFDGANNNSELRMAVYGVYGGMTDLSMIVWLRYDDTALARRNIGGLQQNAGGGRYVFDAAHYENNNPTPGIQSFARRADDSPLVQTRNPISFQQWHMWVMTYENGMVAKSYLDGVEVDGATADTSVGLYAPEALLFGVDIDGSREWKGQLDEIAIFDRALSANEVGTLFNAAVVPEPSTLCLMGLGAFCLLFGIKRHNR